MNVVTNPCRGPSAIVVSPHLGLCGCQVYPRRRHVSWSAWRSIVVLYTLRVSKYIQIVMYTLTYRSCVSNTSFVLHVPLRGAAREPAGPIVDAHVSCILHTFPACLNVPNTTSRLHVWLYTPRAELGSPWLVPSPPAIKE